MSRSPQSTLLGAVVLGCIFALVSVQAPAGESVQLMHLLRQWAASPELTSLQDLHAAHAALSLRSSEKKRCPWTSGWRIIARRMSKDNPDTLIPLIALHGQLHRLEVFYLQGTSDKNDYLLSRETEELYSQLIDLYLKTSEHAATTTSSSTHLQHGHVASLFHINLALRCIEQNRYHDAAVILGTARRLDSENLAALHTLGVLYQKKGQLSWAIETFERCLELFPDHQEVQLRLAVTLLRANQEARARRTLETLAVSQGASWTRLLALQELIQLNIAGDDEQQALEWLQEGLQQFPDNERLSLQLLYLSEPNAEASRDIVTHLVRHDRQTPAESPRLRYDRWPEDLDHAMTQLDEEVSARLPLLRRAVAGS